MRSVSPPGPPSWGTAPAPSSPMPWSTSTTAGSRGSARLPRRRPRATPRWWRCPAFSPRAGQRPFARADGAVPRPGGGAAAGPLAARGHVAARGAADPGGRRGGDDRGVGGDAGQRRDDQRGDVLPSAPHRRGGRPHGRAGDDRDSAAAPARAAAVRRAAAGRGGAGRRGTRRRHRRVRHRAARGLHGAAARAPRAAAPPGNTACCCTCTSRRPRARAPTCWPRTGCRFPRCSPRTTCWAAGCSPRTACTWTTATSTCGRSTTSRSRTAPPATPSWPAAAPLRAMLDRGIRVGLGTDGPASNDGLDLFADPGWPRRWPACRPVERPR